MSEHSKASYYVRLDIHRLREKQWLLLTALRTLIINQLKTFEEKLNVFRRGRRIKLQGCLYSLMSFSFPSSTLATSSPSSVFTKLFLFCINTVQTQALCHKPRKILKKSHYCFSHFYPGVFFTHHDFTTVRKPARIKASRAFNATNTSEKPTKLFHRWQILLAEYKLEGKIM